MSFLSLFPSLSISAPHSFSLKISLSLSTFTLPFHNHHHLSLSSLPIPDRGPRSPLQRQSSGSRRRRPRWWCGPPWQASTATKTPHPRSTHRTLPPSSPWRQVWEGSQHPRHCRIHRSVRDEWVWVTTNNAYRKKKKILILIFFFFFFTVAVKSI